MSSPNPNERYALACVSAHNTKDNLMRTIEHLRREADYDYPPLVVRQRIRDVQRAERAYREAWDERVRARMGVLV